MAMTVASVRAVADKNTYLLLSEPIFYIEGKQYEMLSEIELKNKRVAATAGVENEDLMSEGAILGRTVAQLTSIVKQEIDFQLNNFRDARLIYTIIDTFLVAQANLLGQRLGGLKDDMIEDFEHLTSLANRMLAYIEVADRVDLMNAPKEPKKAYLNIFEHMLGGLVESKITVIENTTEEDEASSYQSPFSQVIKDRRHLNRVNRFTY